MIECTTIRRPARTRLARLAASALLVLGVVASPAPAEHSTGTTVGLIAKEFLFDPRDLSAGSGEIAFLVKNQGAIEHNLVLVAPGGKTVTLIGVIEPGQTMKVTVSLPAGVYPLYCSLPGHKDAGMAATLRVNQ